MKHRLQSNRFTIAAAVSYGLLLTYLLVVPAPLWMFGVGGAETEEAIDRSITGDLQHIAAYSVLSVLVLLAANGRSRWRAALLLVVVHALIGECIQFFVPRRYADVRDLAANFVGIVVGTLLFLAFVRLTRPVVFGHPRIADDPGH